MNLPTWSTPIADVERSLKRLEATLTAAKKPDGSVALDKAKALAGSDARLGDLVQAVRTSRERPTLTPPEARRAFLELQVALRSARDLDADHDGRLGFREVAFRTGSDDLAERLVARAAIPLETSDGERPRARVALSLEARREAEKIISETAKFHAATPLGAEALAWDMRLRVVEGFDVKGGIVFDAVNFSESDWRAKLPLLGKRYRGEGHLSDKELQARFGDLGAYVEKTKAAVNALLLMDYASGFLAGKDLAP